MKRTFIIISCCLLGVLALRWQIQQTTVQSSPTPVLQSASHDSNALRVTFLDVGQGDASLIDFTNGEQMLVDCSSDSRILSALGRVMKFYDNQIDYLLVSHPDLDHYGGCEDVLRRFDVKHIITNGFDKDYDSAWRSFKQAIVDEKAEWVIIDSERELLVSNSVIQFLYPDHSLASDASVPDSGKAVESNYTSIIFELVYKNKKVLFVGDAGEEEEDYIVKKYGTELDVDVIKVGHHGSYHSSSDAFLKLVTPQIAVISVGAGNSYGHPSHRTMRRLENIGSTVYRTDIDKDVGVEIGDEVGVVK
ncbi:MAG: MBL fold metallo-hydrolase [Patescibacteria group bacterium]